MRGLSTAIAQYYGLVQEGMFGARHVFQGLERPLMLADDMNADQTVYVYTWKPFTDYFWNRDAQNGSPEPTPAEPGLVFAVLVRREDLNDEGVVASVEKWNWLREDPTLPDAPIDWKQRYNKRLWTR